MTSRTRFFSGLLSCLVGAWCLLAPIAANAQASSTGQWTKLINLPAIPVHDQLLPNGKVMMWGRVATGDLMTWDPATQAVATIPGTAYDLFCAGHSFLSDGRLLVPGGHIVDFVGLAKASVYDPATNTWTRAPDMNAGRWYPTVTPLANGDALVVAGQIDTTVGMNTLPQVYQAATNTWRDLTGAQLDQPTYPMMFLAPNGKVIDVAPTRFTRYLDTTGTGAWIWVGTRIGVWRDYGSAVLYGDGKILVAGGGDPPTATAEVINLNVATPAWRAVASMSVARRHLNLTLLPDGTVLATGGTSGAGHNNPTAPVFAAQLWNPATEAWTTLASATVPRLYHSSALLLPDGRVLTTGGDGYTDVEVFSPPYLFKGARPAISAAPASIGYGQQFTVASPEASGIAKVTMIRIASVTHAFDQSQRINLLPFTVGTGALNVTAPANGNLAPPGHYMLFIVNGNGVPSVGSIVQVGAGAPVPPGPALSSIAPSSATVGGPAFTLTVNGSNFVSGATVRWNGAARSTTFVSSTQVRAAIPAGDIAAAGTAQVSVANPSGSATGTLPFTIAPRFQLTVTRNGNAASRGTIISAPGGINCGSTCNAAFAVGATVTLSMTTSGNGVFAGWGGACSGTGTCTVTMNGNTAVTATINRR